MEAAAAGALGSSSVSALRSPIGCKVRSDLARPVTGFVSFTSGASKLPSRLSQCSSISVAKYGCWQHSYGSRRAFCVKASAGEIDSTKVPAFTAPLQPESPIGLFLSQILVSHPHLLPAAVEQQLQQLNVDRDAETSTKEEPSSTSTELTGTDLVLYRRIAEVKANDRKRALEEILYTLIVKKFMDAGLTLVPAISQPSDDPSGRIDNWPTEEEKLENLHSAEAAEMIRNHLRLILGQRIGDSDAVAPISKLRVGQVYAASLMYGYFLKRVDQRFQLEKSMRTLPCRSDGGETAIEQTMLYESADSHAGQTTTSSHPEVPPETTFEGLGGGIKLSPLRSYVMSFDSETLQRYATIRSKEAFTIIEKHTESLFGRPEIVITPQGTIDSSKDELIKISFGGLKRLILEAVTFGSFLWEVESYVDSRYHFVAN